MLKIAPLAIAGLASLITFAVADAQSAPDAPAPAASDAADAAPGPAEDPANVIVARQLLMDGIADQMTAIDLFTQGQSEDLDDLKNRANVISTMLVAFPYLFPEDSNLIDSTDVAIPTLALNTVWEDFDTFYATASAASLTALDASQATDEDDFLVKGATLRAACDSCHATYMQAYVSPF